MPANEAQSQSPEALAAEVKLLRRQVAKLQEENMELHKKVAALQIVGRRGQQRLAARPAQGDIDSWVTAGGGTAARG